MKLNKRCFIFMIGFFFLTSVKAEISFYTNHITKNLLPAESLEELLETNGYKSSSRSNWKTITMGLNHLTKDDLKSRTKIMKIILPSKKPIHFQKEAGRGIASSRSTCQELDRLELAKTLGPQAKLYRRYIDMLTTRRINVNAGENLIKILRNDLFIYPNLKKTLKRTMLYNGLTSYTLKRKSRIILPFCSSKKVRRSLASLNIEHNIEQKFKKSSPISGSIDFAIGQIDITQNENTAAMKLMKLSVSGEYKISPEYSLSNQLAISGFFNTTSSSASGEQPGITAFPEFSTKLERHFDSLSLGLDFEIRNYFFIKETPTQTELEPSLIYRVALSSSYNITDSITLEGSIGYVKGFNEGSLKGSDLSLGISYAFGKNNKYKIIPQVYQSTTSSDLTSANDNLSSAVLNFSIGF